MGKEKNSESILPVFSKDDFHGLAGLYLAVGALKNAVSYGQTAINSSAELAMAGMLSGFLDEVQGLNDENLDFANLMDEALNEAEKSNPSLFGKLNKEVELHIQSLEKSALKLGDVNANSNALLTSPKFNSLAIKRMLIGELSRSGKYDSLKNINLILSYASVLSGALEEQMIIYGKNTGKDIAKLAVVMQSMSYEDYGVIADFANLASTSLYLSAYVANEVAPSIFAANSVYQAVVKNMSLYPMEAMTVAAAGLSEGFMEAGREKSEINPQVPEKKSSSWG